MSDGEENRIHLGPNTSFSLLHAPKLYTKRSTGKKYSIGQFNHWLISGGNAMRGNTLKFASSLVIAAALFANPATIMAQTHAEAVEDEIIITARKKEETLSEVPLQISVFDSEAIELRDFRDLSDIAQSTPGLEYENYVTAGLSTAPVIRGMSQTFTTSRIQNTAAYLDGVYLQRQSMVNPGLMDTERVEVVKGPQSAIYGRNAFSGAINYVTKKPGDEFEASIGGTVGSGGRYDYKGSIGGPIVEDKVFSRISYGKSEFDGHTDNMHPFASSAPDPGTNDLLGGWDDEIYSGTLIVKPTSSLELSASYYKNKSEREPQGAYYLTGPRQVGNDASWDAASNQANCVNTMTLRQIRFFIPGVGLVTQNVPVFGNHAFCGQLPTRPPNDSVLEAAGFANGEIQVDPRSHAVSSDSEIIQGKISFDFNDHWNASYHVGRVEHEAGGFGIAQGRDSLIGSLYEVSGPPPPFGPPPPPFQFFQTTFNATPQESLKSTSHEFRLGYDGDKFDGRVGVYMSDTKDQESDIFYFSPVCDSDSTCNQTIPAGGPGIPPELIINRGPFVPPLVIPLFPFSTHGAPGNHVQYEDEVIAVFADIDVQVSDTLNLIAEARYEEERKKYNQLTTTFGVPDPISAENKFDFFTPRVTMRWMPNQNKMFYALAAKGIKTGGFNSIDLAVNPGQLTYDEESNWTFELGGKARLVNNKLGLNGAVYYIDWKGIQGTEAANSTDPFAIDVTGNIGDGEVLGMEIDGDLQISDNFFLDFSLALLDPTYKSGIYQSSKTVNADGSPDIASSWGCSDTTPECAATGDISGHTLERTSTKQANLGLNFSTPVNLISNDMNIHARWDFNWRNKMYATPLNLAHNGDRLVSNVNIGLTNDNFTLSVWGKNVFNNDYVANSFVLPSFNRYVVGLGAGRTFGVTAKYDFR